MSAPVAPSPSKTRPRTPTKLEDFTATPAGELNNTRSFCFADSWCCSTLFPEWQNGNDSYFFTFLRFLLVVGLSAVLLWTNSQQQGINWLSPPKPPTDSDSDDSEYKGNVWEILAISMVVCHTVTAVLCVFHGRWQRRLYPVAIQALLVGTYVGYNIWIFVSYYLNGSFPTLTPPSAIDSTLKKIKFDIWLLGRLLLGPCLAVTLPLVWTSLVLLMNLAIALGVKYGMSLSPMEHFEAMISVELVVPLTGWICVVALQNCAYRTLNVPWFSSKNALSKHAVILNEIAARRELKKTAQDHVRHDVNQYYL